ncbi:MAG: hypothetical protein JW894_02845 [Bacteroidales bacterium]|nr:hypothetical protein [Bacteroidales bacterium]
MKHNRIATALIILPFFVLFISSCNTDMEEGPTLPSNELNLDLAMDDVVADYLFENADKKVESTIIELEQNGYQTDTEKSVPEEEDFVCQVITVDHPDSTCFPKVITIDYGDGCSIVFNGDTITRKGKIIITITDRRFVIGSQVITTFEEYFINDVQIEGTRTITFNGLNESGYEEFAMTLEDGRLTFGDGSVYTRDANGTRELDRERIRRNDTVYLSGSMEGINTEGQEYTRTITRKLMLIHCEEYHYRWTIVAGEIVSTLDDVETVVDFGDGSCSTGVLFRIDNETYYFTVNDFYHRCLHHRRHNRHQNHDGQNDNSGDGGQDDGGGDNGQNDQNG